MEAHYELESLEEHQPDLAAFGAQRLHGNVCYLATVRQDGSPRLHPVTPIVGQGHLFVFMEPISPKGHDLRRDGRYALHCSVEERRLAPQSELALFRIVQEAWHNIRRHAQARRADVTFAYTRDGLVVTISDDGRGFVSPPESGMPDGHWGLRGMRERAELTGGRLAVTSRAGQGTRIEVHIPYPGVDGRDPVCGMTVGPEAIGAEQAGQLYRFCSPACRDLFLAQPQQYVAPQG